MILLRYESITLAIDVMKINGIDFFVSKYRHINFLTAEYIVNNHASTILSSITQIQKIYSHRGFIIKTILADGHVQCLENDLLNKKINLNICSNNEHVGDIERMIRLIKERARGIYNTLPFQKLPGRLVIELIYSVIFWLNTFSPSPSVHDNQSPRSIITGRTVDFNKHCTTKFGSYAQTHEMSNNTMQTRTVGAIALRLTGNYQGGHFYLSLLTGRQLNRTSATPLPMPSDVVERIHHMVSRNPKGIQFLDRNNTPITDEDDDNEPDDDLLSQPDINSTSQNNHSVDTASTEHPSNFTGVPIINDDSNTVQDNINDNVNTEPTIINNDTSNITGV